MPDDVTGSENHQCLGQLGDGATLNRHAGGVQSTPFSGVEGHTLLLDHSCQHVHDDRLCGHAVDGDARGFLDRDATGRAAGSAVEFADDVQCACTDDVVQPVRVGRAQGQPGQNVLLVSSGNAGLSPEDV